MILSKKFVSNYIDVKSIDIKTIAIVTGLTEEEILRIK